MAEQARFAHSQTYRLGRAGWQIRSFTQHGADAGTDREATTNPDRQPHGKIAVRHADPDPDQGARQKPDRHSDSQLVRLPVDHNNASVRACRLVYSQGAINLK